MKLLLYSCLTIILSCKDGNGQNDLRQKDIEIDLTVEALNTTKKKEQFLIQLFEDDQKVRDSRTSLEILKRNNYDTKSGDYKSYIKRQQRMDSLNFHKALHYLEKFEYPRIDEFNSSASYAILTIALHQKYKERKILFPYLYEAYKMENIPEDQFANFVWDFYQLKHKKEYRGSKDNKNNIEDMLTIMKLIEL